MKRVQVDVAIVGAGTAGLAAYRAAKEQGKTAVVIEGGPYGTTCARVGCMPSKLLIAAAEAAHGIRAASGFGVHASPPRIDGQAVMRRVKAERDRFVGFVKESIADIPEEDKLCGYAYFLNGQQLQIEDHTQVTASRIVIATGSRPSIPPVFEPAGNRLIINDDVFEWDRLPTSVAVFGPGVIGLELGQALARLGVKVKLFGIGHAVGPITDPSVKSYALKYFNRALDFVSNSQVQRVQNYGQSVLIQYKDNSGVLRGEHFEYLLAATGRQPNVDRLNLEATSLTLDARGVPVFDPKTLQCGDSSIFIAGDANHFLPLLHEAADEGRTAGVNAAHFPRVVPGHRRTSISVVFTDPQIAMVGESYQALKVRDEQLGSVVIGSVSFVNQGRSRVMRKNKGMMNLYADRHSGEILGAEMIGPAAEHLAHLLAWAIQQRMTVQQALEMPFYHPVIEEGLRTALREAQSQLV